MPYRRRCEWHTRQYEHCGRNSFGHHPALIVGVCIAVPQSLSRICRVCNWVQNHSSYATAHGGRADGSYHPCHATTLQIALVRWVAPTRFAILFMGRGMFSAPVSRSRGDWVHASTGLVLTSVTSIVIEGCKFMGTPLNAFMTVTTELRFHLITFPCRTAYYRYIAVTIASVYSWQASDHFTKEDHYWEVRQVLCPHNITVSSLVSTESPISSQELSPLAYFDSDLYVATNIAGRFWTTNCM